MDEFSLLRAHSHRGHSGGGASLGNKDAFPQAISNLDYPAPSNGSSIGFAPPVLLTPATGLVSSSSGSNLGVVKKKKKKKRVVEDIAVIGHEYEEKERILAERQARNNRAGMQLQPEEDNDDASSIQGESTQSSPVVEQEKEVTTTTFAVPSPVLTATIKPEVTIESIPLRNELIPSTLLPDNTPDQSSIISIPISTPAAAPTSVSLSPPPPRPTPATVTPSIILTSDSPVRVPVRGRYSLTPNQQQAGPPQIPDEDQTILAPPVSDLIKEEAVTATTVESLPTTTTLQPRSIFNAAAFLPTDSTSAILPLSSVNDSTAATSNPEPVPPIENIIEPSLPLPSSSSFRASLSKSSSFTHPTTNGRSRSSSRSDRKPLDDQPIQPSSSTGISTVAFQPLPPMPASTAVTPVTAASTSPPITVTMHAFESPPRVREAHPSPTPFTSPPVNAHDLAVVDATNGADGVEAIAATFGREKRFSTSGGGASGNLSLAIEAAAALNSENKRRKTSGGGGNSGSKGTAVVGSLAPPTLPSSSQPNGTVRHQKQVLLESTDEYDVFLNQLASSPAADSPQLRAMLGGRSASPASHSHLSSSPSSMTGRPQLASLGLAYISEYFDQTKQVTVSEDELSQTTSTTSKTTSPPMKIPHRLKLPGRDNHSSNEMISIDGEAANGADESYPAGSPIGQGQHIKTLIRPVTKEPMKELMKRQGDKCATCEKTIYYGLFSKPRYCHYTGGLYCTECHLKEKRHIPGKVLVHGDCKKYSVCTLAVAYLDTMYSIPSIPMAAISPTLYQSYRALGLMFVLRQQLAHIRAFIMTCKKKDALLALLGQRQYMLNDTLIRSNGSATVPQTAPAPQPSMMAQSVTSDAMPSIAVGSYFPQKSLLPKESATYPPQPIVQDSPPSSQPQTPLIEPGSSPVVQSSFHRSSRSRMIPPSPRGKGSSSPAIAEESQPESHLSKPDPFDPAIDDPILNPTLRDMYSLRDIVEVLSGDFLTRLTLVVRQLMAHIMGGRCEICKSKAFYCEMPGCQEPETPIYSFQLSTVVQCPTCAQSFHRACFTAPEKCPKCLRLAARKLAQQQKLIQAKQSALTRMTSLSSSPSQNAGAATLTIPQPILGGRGLGFAPTGGSSILSGRGELVDRTRTSGTSRGSSPVRQMNERIAGRNNRSASPAVPPTRA